MQSSVTASAEKVLPQNTTQEGQIYLAHYLYQHLIVWHYNCLGAAGGKIVFNGWPAEEDRMKFVETISTDK